MVYIYDYNKYIYTYSCIYILYQPLIRVYIYGYNIKS